MQIRLDVGRTPELKVYRPPQEDMTISIAESEVKSDVPERLDALLQAISVSNTVRTFSFNSLEGETTTSHLCVCCDAAVRI
jgi:hypothetical protein